MLLSVLCCYVEDNGEALFNKQKTGIQINKEYLGEVDVRMFCHKTSKCTLAEPSVPKSYD